MEASGCLPGWAGAIALGLAGAVAFIRRDVRRSRRKRVLTGRADLTKREGCVVST
jgi:hypothetical protein